MMRITACTAARHGIRHGKLNCNNTICIFVEIIQINAGNIRENNMVKIVEIMDKKWYNKLVQILGFPGNYR